MYIEDIFKKFEELKIMIVGDVMLDHYIFGKVNRIAPEAPIPVVETEKEELKLGGAANVAANLKALGAKPFLFSIMGTDKVGENIMLLLKGKGVDNKGCIRLPQIKTTEKIRIIGNQQHIARIDYEERQNVKEAYKEIMKKTCEALPKVDVIIFSDYDKGCLNEEVIEKIIQLAKEHNIPVLVDPKKDHFFSYKNTTVFKTNLKSLQEYYPIRNTKLEDQKYMIKILERLRCQVNAEIILLTLAEKGMFIIDAQNSKYIPTNQLKVKDTAGAGDNVIALASLLVGLKHSLLPFGSLLNIAGELACERLGTNTMEKEALLQKVKKLKA